MNILVGNFNFLSKGSEEFRAFLYRHKITHYTVFGYILMDNIGETSELNNIGLEYVSMKDIKDNDILHATTTYDYLLLSSVVPNIHDVSYIGDINYKKYLDRSYCLPYELRNHNYDFNHKIIDPQVPLAVYIETTTGCNSSCQFCRAHEVPIKRMSDKVFSHTLDLLRRGLTREQESRLLLFPFNNNEPLLDSSIVERCSEIRKALPMCNLMFSTNGKLLQEKEYKPLLGIVDAFFINDYKEDYDDEELSILPGFREEALRSRNFHKISICPRQYNERLFSKDKYDKWFRVKAGCVFPGISLIIGSTGEIKLCCFNNRNSSYYMGSVMDYDSLEELWLNERYREIRLEIQRNRQLHRECRNCDANCTYPSLEVEK